MWYCVRVSHMALWCQKYLFSFLYMTTPQKVEALVKMLTQTRSQKSVEFFP